MGSFHNRLLDQPNDRGRATLLSLLLSSMHRSAIGARLYWNSGFQGRIKWVGLGKRFREQNGDAKTIIVMQRGSCLNERLRALKTFAIALICS